MCQARARRPERERACARELDRASRWHSTAMLLFPSIVLGALCVAASVSVQECGSGNGACAAPEAAVRIVSPAEGEALTARLPAGAAALGRVAAHGIVEIEARGAFAKVALYLDGQFVSATLLGAAVGRVELEFPLPSGAEACGRWHFVEVALMDAEDWRLENPEAAASVRFTLGCAGQDSSAAARHAAAAREEREKRERAQVFAGIYESFGWEPSADGSKETRSGPGSYVARTNASRAFLSDVLRRFNVGSVLDAGCGDVNWQGLTPGIDEVDYFGIDIVPQMIADNVRRLGGPGRRMRFAVKDVVKDDLGGPYDLVLCRDTLFHLPLWDAVQALRNLQATDARYFLSHYDEDLNTNWPDIPAGGWHMINLLAPPFKLPPPLLSVPEAGNEGDAGAMAHYGQSRKLGLWEFPVLPPVPSTRSASSSSPADTTSVAFSAPADTGPQEEGGDGTGPDAGAPREGGGDAGAEHEVYGWVGQKQQHTLKRCVLVAPGSVESVESVGGQSARHHLPPGGQWWPVDVIFSIAGGVAGSEGGRGVVNEVPAHGVNGRVDEALLSAASSLGVEIVGSGGNMAGAKASGGGKIVSAGARGLLAAVWLGCGPVLLVGGWGAGAEGELLQVRGLGGSAGKDPEVGANSAAMYSLWLPPARPPSRLSKLSRTHSLPFSLPSALSSSPPNLLTGSSPPSLSYSAGHWRQRHWMPHHTALPQSPNPKP